MRYQWMAALAVAGAMCVSADAQQKRFEAQTGTAAYYSHVFEGRRTADHGHFHNSRMVAASSTIPLGTRVRVTNLKNNRSVVVKVVDLYSDKGRIIDLSKAAARKLGFTHAGTAQVKVEPV